MNSWDYKPRYRPTLGALCLGLLVWAALGGVLVLSVGPWYRAIEREVIASSHGGVRDSR
jgi:hypothetical protein